MQQTNLAIRSDSAPMPDYKPGLTLITCTGGRPQAFAMCASFVERQTWTGPFQWVVVDDVSMEFPISLQLQHKLLTQIIPSPKWQPGQNTLARNLRIAIPEVVYDKVLFIEDDDWYAPTYCAERAARLEHAAIVGELISKYYNVRTRQYRIMKNAASASLCQTGIRAELLPVLADVCREPDFIDGRLWMQVRGDHRDLKCVGTGCIGIKGMPGRAGIGVGHRPHDCTAAWGDDQDLIVLRTWVGDDVELYKEFL